MAQGYTGYSLANTDVGFKDSPALDAFSRLRISNPVTLFSNQFTYNLNPLLFEVITSGTGANVTHDTTNRCAAISFSSTPTNNKAYMQTYEYFPYQPGKSQLTFITFNMEGGAANVIKFAGISDGVNGIEFQNNNSVNAFQIYSGTGTSPGESVLQSSWNLDKLDGSGPSGLSLDVTKTQILVIDFQALYVGRVRVGFDFGGKIIYCHEFLHSNSFTYPYLQYATLPIRCGMLNNATATTTMKFICCTVMAEGGTEDSNLFGYNFVASTGSSSISIGASSWVHVLSIRPKTTFINASFKNRTKFVMTDLDMANTGNGDLYWQLCIGQSYTIDPGSWGDINTSYSAMEYSKDTAATFTGSTEIVIDSGVIPKTSGGKGQPISVGAFSRYPITLDQAGAVRQNGTLTLKVYGIGASSIYANLKFKEIR